MAKLNPFSKEASSDSDEQKTPLSSTSGMTRKSAAKAKPAREAAQSVRIAPTSSKSKVKHTPSAPQSKDARKAQRRAEREEEDQIASITELVMKQDPRYLRLRRVWWGLLIVGVVFIAVSFAVVYGFGAGVSNVITSTTDVISVVTLVISYAIILAAIIWEFVKIRPLRNEASAKVRGMSAKKRRAVVEQSYKAQEQRRAEKAARKASKK